MFNSAFVQESYLGSRVDGDQERGQANPPDYLQLRVKDGLNRAAVHQPDHQLQGEQGRVLIQRSSHLRQGEQGRALLRGRVISIDTTTSKCFVGSHVLTCKHEVLVITIEYGTNNG